MPGSIPRTHIARANDAVGVALLAEQEDGLGDGSDPPRVGREGAVPGETAVGVGSSRLTYTKTSVIILPTSHTPDNIPMSVLLAWVN